MNLSARIAATFNRSGSGRGDVVGAAAVPAVSRGSEGSGVPSSARLRATLATLVLALAAFAVSAAPALAAPPSTQMDAISEVSYTTAHVTGKVTTDGSVFGTTAYSFQYSTDGTNWSTGFASGFGTNIEGPATAKKVDATISVPKGATQYFVRLVAQNGFFVPPPPEPTEAVSPGPDPSFNALAVDPPTLPGAVGASQVFSTSATVAGKVKRPENKDPAFDVSLCRFEYVSDAEFTATGFATANPVPCEPATPFTTPGGETDVTAAITRLSPGTDYHLRLVAEDAAPAAAAKEAASPFTTESQVTALPTVLAVGDATGIGKRSAQAAGEVERPAGADPALDVECRFEYVSDERFTATGFTGAEQSPCAQNPIGSPGAGHPAITAPVTAELSGLLPDTTYHLRLTAQNGAGEVSEDAADTFTTEAVVHPTFTLDPVTEIGYTKAHLTGTLDPGNQGAQFTFEYALSGTEEWFELATLNGGGMVGVPGPGQAPKQLAWDIGPSGFVYHDPASGAPYDPQPGPGLKPGTAYKARGAWFDLDEFNAYSSGTVEFTTEGTPDLPGATLDPVTIFTGSTAQFTGTVDPNAPAGPLDDEGKATYATDWHLVCTPDCNDANGNPIGGTVEAQGGAQSVSGEARRLEPNKHYEVKMLAHNATGTVETTVQTFDTPLIKPTVNAAAGGSDRKGGYTLQGTVNPNNSPVTACEFRWGPNSASYAFSAPCSPAPGAGPKAVTVEAHLGGLTPGATYHYDLVAANGAGTEESGNQTFVATLSPAEACLNEQVRTEDNSLALPECRAYEMVTPPGKEGFDTKFTGFSEDRVSFTSFAGNLAKSGQNIGNENRYVAARNEVGWQTIPDLNGASGTLKDGPSFVVNDASPLAYSSDLLSSLWDVERLGVPGGAHLYLRNPEGTFTLIGPNPDASLAPLRLTSADLSHVVVWPNPAGRFLLGSGEGIYEYVGTGVDQPRLVDIDNSGSPITACTVGLQTGTSRSFAKSISSDGRVISFLVIGGCGGANPATNEIWARVDGTTSIDVSASECERTAADPGGVCNGPLGSGGCAHTTDGQGGEVGPGCRGAQFQGAAEDGSRVFFTGRRQLVNGDTDQTNDLYACDIPSGHLDPSPGKANSCAGFRQISIAQSGAAEVEDVLANSTDGSSVLFTAKGVLASNEDALGEAAVAGGHNLYVWRQDSLHPAGRTAFVGRLDSEDLSAGDQAPQLTPDGRFVVFTTATQLVPTDTDEVSDVYRYDVESGALARVSTNIFGVGGNGPFDATIPKSGAVSEDGRKVVFTTSEALSPADGNAEPDIYLWTPARVSLISTGSVGGGAIRKAGLEPIRPANIAIDGSGQNIYFETRGALTPADGDDLGDIYAARVGGGVSFARAASCSGEACQAPSSESPSNPSPATAQSPGDGGNAKPKVCPKGKVTKGSKCVRKKTKRHRAKRHHKKHHGKKHHGRKAGSGQGGGK